MTIIFKVYFKIYFSIFIDYVEVEDSAAIIIMF